MKFSDYDDYDVTLFDQGLNINRRRGNCRGNNINHIFVKDFDWQTYFKKHKMFEDIQLELFKRMVTSAFHQCEIYIPKKYQKQFLDDMLKFATSGLI